MSKMYVPGISMNGKEVLYVENEHEISIMIFGNDMTP